ncbi:MAG: FtsX-like permease family protein [Anaerolineae bacterium]|nr:MAG: FtsX-like permease family protein [Anaerolineae bacterium]
MNLNLMLASRYLGGRKLRTFLTTLAIVFGVVILFGMNIILPSMMQAMEANMKAAAGVVDFSISSVSGDAFDPAVMSRLEGIEEISAVAPSFTRIFNLGADFLDNDPDSPDRITAIQLVGMDPDAVQTLRAFPISSGRFLQSGDTNAAVISQSLADAQLLTVGDTLTLPSVNGLTDLTLVGILPPRTLPGNEEVYTTLSAAQEMSGQPGRITSIDVNVALDAADQEGRDAVAAEIQSQLGSSYTIGALSSGTDVFAVLQMSQAILSMFGVMALFMGGFIIHNTFRTVLMERQHDIGMLRAVGASRRTILGLFIAEGLIQGVLGTIVGLALGYLLGVGILKAAEGPISAFVNIRLDNPVVSPGIVLLSIVMGIGVTVVAGILPAVRASRITPLEALRPTSAQADFERERGRGFWVGALLVLASIIMLFVGQEAMIAAGGFVFLIGLVFLAPAIVRPVTDMFSVLLGRLYAREGTGEVARGNMLRQPARVATTASASMIGLAVIVAVGAVLTSMTGTMTDVLRQNLGSDYLMVPPSIGLWANNVGASAGLAEELSAIDGVGPVATTRFAGSASDGVAISLLGIDPAIYPQVSGMAFQEGDESAYEVLAAGRAMIVNGAFLMATGAELGDTLELATPDGVQSYRIVAVAADMFNAKVTTAFISQANMAADFGRAEDVLIQLNLEEGAEAETVDTEIRAIMHDYPQFNTIAGRAYVEQMLGYLNAVFSALYFLLAFLAVPSLIAMLNTLTISVIERTREIGMLRAVGATRRQVRRMVTAEALLLAGIGTGMGLLSGLYLGYSWVVAMDAFFPMSYSFPIAGLIAGLATGLIFGALAGLIPARQAAKMDVVAALRYE